MFHTSIISHLMTAVASLCSFCGHSSSPPHPVWLQTAARVSFQKRSIISLPFFKSSHGFPPHLECKSSSSLWSAVPCVCDGGSALMLLRKRLEHKQPPTCLLSGVVAMCLTSSLGIWIPHPTCVLNFIFTACPDISLFLCVLNY